MKQIQYLLSICVYLNVALQFHHHLSSFVAVTLKHAAADSYTVVGLEEFVDYELFVQPFNEAGIVGLPSALKLVKTHQTHPAASPVVLEAKMINATMLLVAWNPIHEDDRNGPLWGFKVSCHFPSLLKVT